jgi:hypothetical protein
VTKPFSQAYEQTATGSLTKTPKTAVCFHISPTLRNLYQVAWAKYPGGRDDDDAIVSDMYTANGG